MRLPLWPRRSTRAFFREGRQTAGYSLLDLLHGYVYGRWPYLYIGVATGEHPLARWIRPVASFILDRLSPNSAHKTPAGGFADTYHGKVMSLEAAQQLVMVQEDIHLPNLEQVIPYQTARDIVLQQPDHIVVLECPCRAARANPCRPLDVCLIVGEPFASFVAEHHPKRARWLTRAEAIEILQAEHERGHVHHAFFKDAMLGRFYAICNCCSCCCGAMQAHRTGTPMLASSGYVAQVDADSCLACGVCANHCPFAAISVNDGLVHIDASACMGCGVCVSQCPQGAISLLREPAKGEPLEIRALLTRSGATRRD